MGLPMSPKTPLDGRRFSYLMFEEHGGRPARGQRTRRASTDDQTARSPRQPGGPIAGHSMRATPTATRLTPATYASIVSRTGHRMTTKREAIDASRWRSVLRGRRGRTRSCSTADTEEGEHSNDEWNDSDWVVWGGAPSSTAWSCPPLGDSEPPTRGRNDCRGMREFRGCRHSSAPCEDR